MCSLHPRPIYLVLQHPLTCENPFLLQDLIWIVKQRLHLGSAGIKNNFKPRFLKRSFQADTLNYTHSLYVSGIC